MTGTPLSRYLTVARLVSHRPREEKNDHNSTTDSSEKRLKSHNKPITKPKYGCRISVIIDLVKSKNPYIFFTFYKTQKCQSVMLSVGGTESPHTHNTLQAFEDFYAGERVFTSEGEGLTKMYLGGYNIGANQGVRIVFVFTATNRAIQGNTDPFITVVLAVTCVVSIALLIWVMAKRY